MACSIKLVQQVPVRGKARGRLFTLSENYSPAATIQIMDPEAHRRENGKEKNSHSQKGISFFEEYRRELVKMQVCGVSSVCEKDLAWKKLDPSAVGSL